MKIALSTLVVVHLIASLWHGDAHSGLAIALSDLQNLFIYVVIIGGPIIGVGLLWTRYAVLGTGIVAVSMIGALIFGVYHHYILVSPDNIAHLPIGPPGADSQFINSAAVIAGRMAGAITQSVVKPAVIVCPP